MSKRPPNEFESKLHQAALAAPKQEITSKQAEAIIPDPNARQKAINFLLGVGLLKALASSSGSLIFRAVTKDELNATKDLTGEENLVLNHISGSRNEGIWVKQLKAKTNLHQTVIDRCIKTLLQKKMIKRVQSVQHPTRKIYMLEHLEPSIALTGGPWYTDSELDTEFIQMLLTACLRFIRDKSFPKRRSSETQGFALFPISNAPQYPTAQNIKNFLKQSRITETELTIEHVEMLLNVLVLDGEIEKVPAFGATLWDASAINDNMSSSDEERSKRKRKHGDADSDDNSTKSKKRKKQSKEYDPESPKKSKKKRRSKDASDDKDSDVGKHKKKRKKKIASDDESESEDDESSKKKAKKRKSKKRKHETSSESESSSSSESESESESRRAKSSRKSSKSRQRSASPFQVGAFEDFAGSANVYRAIKQERVVASWSQAPCANCPSFEFCKDGGPVNPSDCVYYGSWLAESIGGAVAASVEHDW